MRPRDRRSSPTVRVLGWAVALVLASAVPAHGQERLAVIANQSSPFSDVSLSELSKIFLGQVTNLDADDLSLAEYAPTRASFYHAVLGMTESQVDRHWIGVVFRGGETRPPRKLSNAAALRDFVSHTPGAIAFVPLDSIDASVKVLTVDGHAPSDPDYPILG